MSQRVLLRVMVFCVSAIFTVSANGQLSSVDADFAPVTGAVSSTGNLSLRYFVQPDNKVVIWGGDIVSGGQAKGRLARLNADGSADASFNFCNCGLDQVINAARLPDGRVLVAGSLGVVAKVIRVNSDGSLDPTFNFVNPSGQLSFGSMSIAGVQSDGRFFGARTQSFQGFSELTLFHFNADGSVNPLFTAISIGSGTPNFTSLSGLAVLPDGRFYVAQSTFAPFQTTNALRRFLPNGTPDPTWSAPNITSLGAPSNASISSIDLHSADGTLIVSGNFDVVNGVPKADIVRLLPAGNVDLQFNGPAYFTGGAVKVLPNGQILYSALTDIGGTSRIFRLNQDGALDGSFVMDPAVESVTVAMVIDSLDRPVFIGRVGGVNRFVRLLPTGAIDTSFVADHAFSGQVYAIARQADGRVLIAGKFTQVNGIARTSIARVFADGTLDTSFNGGAGFDSPPRKFLFQPDGKILAVGTFATYNGAASPYVLRLNTDGSLDGSFAVSTTGAVNDIEFDGAGNLLMAGSFSAVNGLPRNGVVRILPGNIVDPTLNPVIGSPNLNAIRSLPGGKILIGGSFNGVNGFNRTGIARLESNGTLDTAFVYSGGSPQDIAVQPDEKLLLIVGNSVARRNQDGSADASFTVSTVDGSGDVRVDTIYLNPDNSILIGGQFDRIGITLRKNFARLDPNGKPDRLFRLEAASRVRVISAATVGKVYLGGDFTLIGGVVRTGAARLSITPFAVPTRFDFDGDGRADVSVYRPSTNRWYILRSSDATVDQIDFGLAGDIATPEDWDGDGRFDLGIFRPTTGTWWYRSSNNGSHLATQFGAAGDVPRPGDYNGDGKVDFVVFRPSQNRWYLNTGSIFSRDFGLAGDKAVSGDFDKDRKFDLAIYRPSTGTWWYASSANGEQHRAVKWGIDEDVPTPADFDGDGFSDMAVYRPSTRIWYILNSNGSGYTITNFGLPEDKPVAADYDGDGKADIALYRPSTGIWYLLNSSSGFAAYQFGLSTDVALPNTFVP